MLLTDMSTNLEPSEYNLGQVRGAWQVLHNAAGLHYSKVSNPASGMATSGHQHHTFAEDTHRMGRVA